MATAMELPAEIRELQGKGASRRLRRAGLVPGIVYGGGKDPVAIQLQHAGLIRATENESFYSSILELTVGDGRTQKVVLRDLHRHPAAELIMHIDFQRVSDKEKLRISVPLNFTGEEESPAGKQSGVVISHQMTEIEISCFPKDIPEHIEVDLSEMDVGDSVHLAQIKLPEGVEIIALTHGDAGELTVASAQHVQTAATTTDEEGEEAEGEEGAPAAAEPSDDDEGE